MIKENLVQKVMKIHEKSTFSKYFNIKYLEAEEGYFKAEVLITEKFHNSMGTCHGGATAAIIDTIGGAVTYTVISEDEFFSTMNFRVDFLAPINSGEKIQVIGKVLRKGTRVVLSQVNILNKNKELVANGTISNLILKKKK